ncbi:uncharacterized protein CG3556-like [Schistocerca cancellata]|uniref:uncharacterized protein CG3556-like n=1 Tax=Schistocerca cancellata TaxID=274614 RepID=UPI00211922D8|nr:uncharacterized protein CG3556-like [Schistocerca cancellata]
MTSTVRWCLLAAAALLVATPEVAAQNPEARRAAAWLEAKRRPDGGWEAASAPGVAETARAVLALRMAALSEGAVATEAVLPPAEALAVKQMELELVLLLWRHHEAPVSPRTLARYCLALTALCKDARNFYGHDIVNMLHNHEAGLEADYALSSLAVCSAGHNVRRRQIRRLSDVVDSVAAHDTDTLSLTLLALSCTAPDHHHRNLGQLVRRLATALASRQTPAGGFGPPSTTALAIQALDAADAEAGASWNRTSAVAALVAEQAADGSFGGSVASTADALLALSPRGLASLRDVGCAPHRLPPGPVSFDFGGNSAPLAPPLAATTSPGRPDGGSSAGPSDEVVTSSGNRNSSQQPDEVTVTYSLWVGTEVSENYSLTLRPARNSSFYNVMMLAAQQDEHYQFEATEWPNGHYVHTLAGRKEESASYLFWLLYQTPTLPNPADPPSNQLITPVGVDGLFVDEGDHYLFWYKKL